MPQEIISMVKKIKGKDQDLSTQDKILEAARDVFTQKGFAATRTRDIAETAGINLALLNYYYRSKEKLFQQVMEEKRNELFGQIDPICNDPDTTLERKIELIVNSYITMLRKNPDLPIFVLSEIQKNPGAFHRKVPLKNFVLKSSLATQLKERRMTIHPINMVWNILGLTVFPFISRPVLMASGVINEQIFDTLIEERKKMLPIWIISMLKNNNR